MKKFIGALGLIVLGFTIAKITVEEVQASGVLALPPTVVFTNKTNVYTKGPQDMSAVTWKAPSYIVSMLPSAAANPGVTVQVTDGATASDCTVGMGSTTVWCRSDGASWSAVGGASAGSGTVNSGGKGDGTYYAAAGTAVSPFSLTGIANFRTGVGAPIAALAADVIGLFSGCSGTLALSADGQCHANSGLTQSGFYYTTGGNYFTNLSLAATLPVAGNYTWLNQGTATETASGNGLLLTDPATVGDQLRIRFMSIGSNTNLVALVVCNMEPVTAQHCGLGFRESATAKIETWGMSTGGTNQYTLTNDRWTNPTTYGGVTSYGKTYPPNPLSCLSLQISGSNMLFKASADCVNFVTLYTEAKTSFFTTAPDQWFYYADSTTTGTPAFGVLVTLLHWATS